MKYFYLIAVICLCIFFNTCKDGTPGPKGKDAIPGVGILNGTISGFVYLNSFQNVKFTDHSGAQVILSDTNKILSSTFTDKSGKFNFKDIKSGSYKITCKKEDYITTVVSVINFLGGEIPFYTQAFNLSQPSQATVSNFKIDSISNNVDLDIFYCSFNAFSNPIGLYPVRFFLGKDKNVSKNDYLYTEIFTTTYYTLPSNETICSTSGFFNLNASNLVGIDSVCLIAYGSFWCPINVDYIGNDGICDFETQTDGSLNYIGLGQPSAVVCKAKPQ